MPRRALAALRRGIDEALSATVIAHAPNLPHSRIIAAYYLAEPLVALFKRASRPSRSRRRLPKLFFPSVAARRPLRRSDPGRVGAICWCSVRTPMTLLTSSSTRYAPVSNFG